MVAWHGGRVSVPISPPPPAREPPSVISAVVNLALVPQFDREPGSVTRAVHDLALDRSGRDQVASELAARQHGAIARRQLAALGFGRRSIERAVERAQLHPAHRGVYLLGHRARGELTTPMAAVLAAGPGAMLSHASAAALWRIRELQPAVHHVTLPGRTPSDRRDLELHRTGPPPAADAGIERGIPVTAPARTLLDLAAHLRARDLRWAVEEARSLRLVTPADLHAVLERHPGRRGTGRLRLAVDALFGEPAITRTEAERLLHDIIRRCGVPQPRSNVRVRGWSVDAHWPSQAVVAEVDSFAYHSSRTAFERDRRKDAALQAAGLRVVRVSWRQLVDEPETVAALLVRLLER